MQEPVFSRRAESMRLLQQFCRSTSSLDGNHSAASEKHKLRWGLTCWKSQGQMVSFMPSSSSPDQSAVCEP